MKLRIKIDLDADAFGEDFEGELNHIFADLPRVIRNAVSNDDAFAVLNSWGERVGVVSVS
jgi:hypothetical protein